MNKLFPKKKIRKKMSKSIENKSIQKYLICEIH